MLVAVTMLGGAVLLNGGLKRLFARVAAGAVLRFLSRAGLLLSFPSGHALFATCFFGGIAVLIAHRLESRAGPRSCSGSAPWS